MLLTRLGSLLLLIAVAAALPTAPAPSLLEPQPQYRDLPPLREQNALEQSWVHQRWQRVPSILRKHGYDAWILSMREYAEDTAFRALVPSTTVFSARRRTLFLFHTSEQLTSPLLLIDNTDTMWTTLNTTLFALDPARIAIDTDSQVAFGDGLHSGEKDTLLSHLHPKYAARTSSKREIPVEVIALRAGGASQLEQYRTMMENVWAMIAEGFSERVIDVGHTTPEDLEWWFRDTMRWKLGVTTWFHPDVNIIRHPALPSTSDDPVFRPGDMLHVDIGITAMGMNTDTQHLGYILRANETAPPEGLRAGLRAGNALQNIVRSEMVPGRTGDEVLAATFATMDDQNLTGHIYSHPIGDYGHSAGAVIGMTNIQGPVPHLGSMKVLEDYWTSIELAAIGDVPEWGAEVRFELEEDVFWSSDKNGFEWVYGQQKDFHLVRTTPAAPASGAWALVRAAVGL